MRNGFWIYGTVLVENIHVSSFHVRTPVWRQLRVKINTKNGTKRLYIKDLDITRSSRWYDIKMADDFRQIWQTTQILAGWTALQIRGSTPYHEKEYLAKYSWWSEFVWSLTNKERRIHEWHRSTVKPGTGCDASMMGSNQWHAAVRVWCYCGLSIGGPTRAETVLKVWSSVGSFRYKFRYRSAKIANWITSARFNEMYIPVCVFQRAMESYSRVPK